MRSVGCERWRWAVMMLGITLLVAPARAQNEESMPGMPQTSDRTERLVYVPLWAAPLGKQAPGFDRRVTADAWWPAVPLGATERAPSRLDEGAGDRGRPLIRLQEFRLSSISNAPGEARPLVAVVRIQPFRPGLQPSLEVIDPETTLQAQATGQLLRRSGDTADYVFRLREPTPPARPMTNPALRRQLQSAPETRRFELVLILQAPRTTTADKPEPSR